jgi:peroxiredoxin Q/BCP
LREDIDRFTSAGATVVAVAPDTAEGVARFVRDRDYPFPLLADTEHAVFDAYDVANRLMSLGQRPAVFVIDRDAIVRFDAIGTQQWQIPANDTVLKLAAAL